MAAGTVRLPLGLILLAALLPSLILSPPAQARPARLMVLGDSISVGYLDNPRWSEPFTFGFRAPLLRRLRQAGCSATFVGAGEEPWNGRFGRPSRVAGWDLRTVGQDHHRGYGGVGTRDLAAGIGPWIAADRPDMILLMAGINDIAAGSEGEPRDAEEGLAHLVTAIFAARPDVVVLVAEITPYVQTTQSIVFYNKYIKDDLVRKFRAEGKAIYDVDQYDNFIMEKGGVDASLYANGINHPNRQGYERMAATWYNAVVASSADSALARSGIAPCRR